MCDTSTDIFWIKKKSQENKTNLGSGDARRDACRLCAGNQGLQSFSNSSTRWDTILYQCFGIMVTALNCMICENCIHQLKNVERFKALVEAAFEKAPSECSSRTFVPDKTEMLTIKAPTRMQSNSREIIRMRQKKNFKNMLQPIMRKANITCFICKRRYTMIVPETGWLKDFICSRCKNGNSVVQRKKKLLPVEKGNRNKGEIEKMSSINESKPFHSGIFLADWEYSREYSEEQWEYSQEHWEYKFRGGIVKQSQPKVKNCASVIKYHREPRKYQCSQCKDKFILPQRLAEHVNKCHKRDLSTDCIVCGNNLKTRKKLERHLKIHTGELQQCNVCKKVLKSKHALQTHLIEHKKGGVK